MTTTQRYRRGFSLIEVLMAIFILGIGTISIAALFPAGIVQQRHATDDVMGPIVAANAIEVLRSKLRAEYFGSYEDFTPSMSTAPLLPPRSTGVAGDWSWVRPAFLFGSNGFGNNEPGSIDIFAHDRTYGEDRRAAWEHAQGYENEDQNLTSFPLLYGIPFAGDWDFDTPERQPPRIIFTQSERFYPQADPGDPKARPQYVWDCMFRRHYGRIVVAIFVYRVTAPGGEPRRYEVAAEVSNSEMPPIPVLPVPRGTPRDPAGAWDAFGADRIQGTADDLIVPVPEFDDCDEIDPANRAYAWQQSGQWLLDQNGNVHRVLGVYCNGDGEPEVELASAIPWSADLAGDYVLDPTDPEGFRGIDNVVTDIWYVPLTDGEGNTLTPVFLTVTEL